MMKKLRFLFVSLMLLFCGSVFADEAVFTFNTADGLKAMGVAEANIPTVAAHRSCRKSQHYSSLDFLLFMRSISAK